MGRKHSRGDDDDALPPSQTQSRLPWGMEKTEMQPSSLAALTDDKLARFVLGHQKKTKFQKEREDREAKKRQADAEAAKIYATFVASFDNEDETKGKAFVRGETTQGKQIVRAGVNGDRPSGGDIYRLKGKEKLPFSGFEVSAVAAASGAGERSGKKMSEMDKMLQELKQKEGEHHSEQRQATHKPKKRRAIDEFLDEMKERGPAPISIESYSDGVTKGSFDNGDPETTNLYVGNLAPTVTEEVLQSEFGRFGDVYSVKIMWPRSEEERARRRNCGFVSFYERRDADEARINLNEMELEGQPMVVGWGKAVKIQPKARAPGVLLPSAVTPPPQIARARDVERGRERNRLSNDDYEDFKELLGELTLERESVKKTMGFALDNSEAAVDLVNIILESFKNASASSVTLVGLLYLTSDILHNSSAAVKNASLFRTTFQECLPEIMDVMRVSHRNIVGRMSANAMKEKVMNVLTAWESWSLFPPAVLVGFHATFLRKVEENDFIATYTQTIEGIAETDPERLRKTCRQAGLMTTGDVRQLIGRLQWLKEFTAPTITPGHGMSAKNPSRQSNINPVNADQPQNASEADTASSFAKSKVKSDDLDGEPIDEDLDGEPIDGEPISEADIDDLDGEPMDEDALDGEPLDADAAEDDLDGEPLYVDDLDGVPMDKEDFDGN
ncbi:U2 snRNP-associated SURP domain-containing protein [Phytophthora boehmeriae]|uniref:U2 snRNP-associated SURP domain-containing protein n=1 Tax=Phytophthora boehmeriae TaxID=109152 RepID=A0A8T1WSS8_9STRA|nr:U2 snRNP-associated SURP domain-containing protein [Phytophthora boehmeriae]